jgi:hypothetical protein
MVNRAWQFQLEQVQALLEKNPGDTKLKALEEKLQKMIALSLKFGQNESFSTEPTVSSSSSSVGAVSDKKVAATLPAPFASPVITTSGSSQSVKYSPNKRLNSQSFNTAHSSQVHRRPADQTEPRQPTEKRSKPSKEEHLRKKEEEHRVKAANWQQFSQKFGISKKPGDPR